MLVSLWFRNPLRALYRCAGELRNRDTGFAALFLSLLTAGCATSSGVPATAIAEPDIASAYIPLHGRANLGLSSADAAAVAIAPGVAVTNDHNDNLVPRKLVLGYGSSSDLMFFRTARAAALRVAAPVVGEAVTSYGQGADADLRIAHGVICDIVRVPGGADSPYFIFAGNSGPGFSGGPVLGHDGQLIGITYGYVDRPGNRRLIFAYDMKRVADEFQRKRPQKAATDNQGVPAPAYDACDRKP